MTLDSRGLKMYYLSLIQHRRHLQTYNLMFWNSTVKWIEFQNNSEVEEHGGGGGCNRIKGFIFKLKDTYVLLFYFFKNCISVQ